MDKYVCFAAGMMLTITVADSRQWSWMVVGNIAMQTNVILPISQG